MGKKERNTANKRRSGEVWNASEFPRSGSYVPCGVRVRLVKLGKLVILQRSAVM